LNGHRIAIEFTGSITDRGEVDNTFTFDILDENNVSVLDLYNVTTEFGTLDVHRARVILGIGKVKKTYNGKEHTAANAYIYVLLGEENLPEGYSVQATVLGKLTNPGIVDTHISAYKIFAADGKDISDNYDVEYAIGSLEVMKVKISIASASAEREYDGTVLKAEKCWIESGQLVEGHRLVAKGIGQTSLSKEDGGDPVNHIEYAIYDAKGNNVTEEFYEVTTIPGTLTIK